MSKHKERPDRTALTTEMSETERMIQEARQRQASQNPATDGRGRPGHAGHLGTDKKGTDKKTYYISRDRQRLVEELAEQEEVSQGNIVEAAIVAFYNAYQAGLVDLYPYKEIHGQSLRVAYRLDLPCEFKIFSPPPQL